MGMDTAQLIFNGVALGSIIAIGAVGLTLTYGILRLSNFAHGDFMTLGAYLTWLADTNIWKVVESSGEYSPNLQIVVQLIVMFVALILGTFGTVGIMLLAEQLLWKPMRDRRANSTTLIIISIGLALFVRSTILFIWGSSNQAYDVPLFKALDVGGVKIAVYRLIVLALVAIAVVFLHFLLQNSKIGKAMRAVADNIDLARVSGINVERVVLWTWVITGVLTAFGGGMFGLITAVRPNMGWFLILPMFASVILGGIGNPYGAIAGALIIGVAQELSIPFLGADYKLGVALLIMVIILLFRPQGLFKGTT